MSKSSFTQLTPVKQLSVYRAFNAEKRIELWKNKIEEVLQMNLSEKERNHIKVLKSVLSQKGYWFGGYTDKSQKQQINNEIDIFAYRWIEYAKEELKWDNVFIYKVAGDPNPMSVIDNFMISNSNHQIATRAEENVCRCHTDWESCKPLNCVKGGCRDDGLKGCGWLWLQDCDGTCGV